ncbi:apolipoprotein N-acyltransferase [Dongia deserti]|uniref:apolipoprotein N-acyltransferase n=1 Tax=Dongia deserti TaxID=2268030 RepID=UPI000E6460AD|nr:apolipoprotein N-acyltransferase [Dongia deserti]
MPAIALRDTPQGAAASGFAGRYQAWYQRRGQWAQRLILMIFGAIAALAFAPVNALPLFAVGLVALIWTAEITDSRRSAFAAGWWWGFGHCLAGFFWIANSFLIDPVRFGWMVPPVIAGLAAYMAVYPALAVAASWHRNAPALARVLLLAAAWTIAEWLRGHLLTGFPWNLAAYVWSFDAPMMQSAALWGAWGLSFFTVLLAGLLSLMGRGSRSVTIRAAVASAVLLAALYGYGSFRLGMTWATPADYKPVTLRLVQGNIDQWEKLTGAHRDRDIAQHLRLSVMTPGIEKVQAVIWPETAATLFLDRSEDWRRYVAAAAPPDGVLITGTLRGDPPQGEPDLYWNSLAVIDPQAEIVATADKFHLVPLGEYVPMRDILGPFITKLTAGAGDFSAGPGPVTVRAPGLPPFSPLICYEVIFPGAVLDPADRPAWLLNVTNDGWFGRSPGPYQHFASARFRAVEEGLPLARAANTGITGMIDPFGRVTAALSLGTEGALDVLLPAPLAPTVFARIGLLLSVVLIFVALAAGVGLTMRANRHRV